MSGNVRILRVIVMLILLLLAFFLKRACPEGHQRSVQRWTQTAFKALDFARGPGRGHQRKRGKTHLRCLKVNEALKKVVKNSSFFRIRAFIKVVFVFYLLSLFLLHW